MLALTLQVKAYANAQLTLVKELLESALEGLKADLQVRGVTSRRWVQVTVSGEDENMAVSFLAREFGQCPERLDVVHRFSTVKGRVRGLGDSKAEVLVDVGIVSPRVVDAVLPLAQLQAQLVDGRKVALEKISQLFGLCENLPLTVKVTGVSEEERVVEAMLAEKQLMSFRGWTLSLLDRLLVFGVPVGDVESALERAECGRDVVDVESLGLFEHAVVCKLGTDAAGLIPRIGRRLRRASFSVFNPRRILELLPDGSAMFASQHMR